jgi:hypothetical protein
VHFFPQSYPQLGKVLRLLHQCGTHQNTLPCIVPSSR